ncbi:85/88 kDa calcium-independent phospholipase A2-like protein [Leptotrombidium deliense]|uniref:85/88 kDa calcium-independent phospholipase A2-like protein n=1 Tax=Leptotrombidium deliense TaxID=299467 RepID=A0A443SKE2_9ACAR|nr:85/88 kDa calcium-independent phospholipase A2-like protein [Leptotrombidium deliense]
MAFLQFVNSFRKKAITEYKWNKVVEVKPDDYICHEVKDREECLVLYSLPESNYFEIVVQKDVYSRSQQTAFSICRLKCTAESKVLFGHLKDKLPPLYSTSPHLVNADILQEVFDYIHSNSEQHLIHVAAHFGFNECIKSLLTADGSLINLVDPKTHKTPLHFAIRKVRLSTVQLLMTFKPNIELIDKDGNNVLHLAAITNKDIIQSICNDATLSPSDENSSSKNGIILKLINSRTLSGFTPLHLACAEDKPDCVKELLKNGADVNGASITLKSSIESNAESFNKQVIDQLEHKDMKNGGTPLHWSTSPQCLEPLLEIGCDINAKKFQGETVLHVMVLKKKLPCIVTLLAYGADVNALGPNGNTPLHLAVISADVTIVQALVVFSANVNLENSCGETPRHIAATSKKSPTQDMILYILSTVGANRCKNTPSKSPCNDGCAMNCFFNTLQLFSMC